MKKMLQSSIYLILTLCLTSLLIFGCAKTPTTTKTSPPSTKPTPVTQAPQPQAGGVLKIAGSTDFTSLGNPPTMNMSQDLTAIKCCIEPLVRADATGTAVPGLATDWKIDSNAKTMTLTLRQGVKFHDGTDFNAAAVKWNLDRYLVTKRTELASVKSVDVVDDYHVRLNLSVVSGLLIFYLGQYPGLMVSPTTWQSGGNDDKTRNAYAELNPVGAGPFKFVSWQKDIGAKFVKFTDYYQKGKPYLDEIDFVFIADPVVAQASFLRGDVDVLKDIRDPKVAKDLETTGKFNVVVNPNADVMLSGDSVHKDTPFYNLKVRQAIWTALNTQAICDALGYGYWKPLNQMALPGRWTYNPDVKGYPYDPVKAKQLLTEAGYPNGFTTTLITANVPPWPDEATAIQGDLAKIGIQAKIQLMDYAAWIQTQQTGWNNAIMLWMGGMSPNEYAMALRMWVRGAATGVSKMMYVPDDCLDLMDKAMAAPDLESMKPIAQQMAKTIIDQYCIMAFPYSQPALCAKRNNLHDDNMYVFANAQHWTPENAWLSK